MGLIYNYSTMQYYYKGVADELKFRDIINIWKHIFSNQGWSNISYN